MPARPRALALAATAAVIASLLIATPSVAEEVEPPVGIDESAAPGTAVPTPEAEPTEAPVETPAEDAVEEAIPAPVADAVETAAPVSSAPTSFYNPEELPVDAPLVGMPDPEVAAFAAAAEELPAELVASLASDVGISGAEWLANSDAAAAAKPVLDGLVSNGVTVLDARMEGADLVVSVADEADAALVASVNAVAELGTGERVDWASLGRTATPVADVYGGEGWGWSKSGSSSFSRCSVAFTGSNRSTGAAQFTTAGHCWNNFVSGDGQAFKLTQSYPWYTGPSSPPPFSNAGTLGARVSSQFGGNIDASIVGSAGFTNRSQVVTWGGNNGAPFATSAHQIVGTAAAYVGSVICRSGSSSGWKCGSVGWVDQSVAVGSASTMVRSSIATVCAIQGDSGGSVIMGNWAVGITSWRTGEGNFCNVGEEMGFFPMVSPGNYQSIKNNYTNWEANVSVSVPTATTNAGTSNGTIARTTTASGTIGNASFDSGARLWVNGAPSGGIVAAPSGSFTLSLPSSVPAGIHTYQLQGRYGNNSASASLSPVRYFTDELAVQRIAGPSRFATAVEISKQLFPNPVTTPVPVVWIANGLNYPDALAAGPAAAKQNGVLLLTSPDALPSEVAAEINRLKTTKVVIVGNAITASVAAQIDALPLVTTVDRVAGADRFETSRLIADYAFPTATTAYISTGLNYPDALSAASVGANRGWPVILVNGTASTAGAPTINLLDDLGVTAVKVVGNEISVSAGVFSSLTAVVASPQRIAGSDRFKTSALIATDAYPSGTKTRVYLTTGLNYPDALTGSVLAGKQAFPLLSVSTNCAVTETLAFADARGVTGVRILGNTTSVGTQLEWFQQC